MNIDELVARIERQSKMIESLTNDNAEKQLEIIRLECRIRDLRENIPKFTNAYNNIEDKYFIDNVLKENASLQVDSIGLNRRLKWTLDYSEKLEQREEELDEKNINLSKTLDEVSNDYSIAMDELGALRIRNRALEKENSELIKELSDMKDSRNRLELQIQKLTDAMNF